MKQSEKTIEKRLKKRVEDLGGLCIKLVPTFFKGLPDRMVLMPGSGIYFVETKSTGDKPGPRQLYVHNVFGDLGFKVHIIDTKEGVDNFLDEINTT